MKKYLCVMCITICLLLCNVAIAGTSASGICGENGDHLSWMLDDAGVLTISGSGRMMDYSADASNPAPWHELRGSIRQIVLGEHVAGIGSHAFEDCALLQNVSNAVDRYALRYVGDCAFRNCTALTGFCLDSTGVDSFQCSLDTIGAYAFQNTGITYADISYTGSVGEGAFADCTSLTSVVFSNKCSDIPAKMLCRSGIVSTVFPPAVRSIGEEAFANCEQLSAIALNDGLRTIGRHAFSECTALTSVAIPQSVKAIADSDADDDFAFSGIGTNIQFTVYDGTPIQSYASAHGNLMPNVTIIQPEFVLDSNDVLTAYNGSDTKVTVPVYVSAIGDNAFQNNPSVAEVALPENIKSIGAGAFSGCTALTTINLDKVTQIGDAAFEGCSSLATIAFDDTWGMKNWLENAETIGSRAFAQCTALTAVELGSRVNFQDDSFETAVAFSIAYDNEMALAKAESLQLNYVRYCETPAYTVDKQMTLIAYTSNCTANISLPAPICAIGSDVFRGHPFLQGSSINVHSPISFIGDYAFSDTAAGVGYELNNFENLTSIGEGAFLNNSGVKYFTIPASVTSIGQNAFDKEEDTLSVYYGSEGYNWVRTNEYTYKVLWPEGFTADNDGVLTAYSGSAANVEIPEGITVISEQVFKDHAEIEHVSIPSTVKSIGASAFEGCTALSALDIPNSVETIGERALAECTMLSSVTLPEGLTAIAKEVFHNDTALTGITLPSGLASIGEGAFYHAGLTAVEFPANLQTIGKNAFYNTALTSVVIPDSVTNLGETAFSVCPSLKSITFGSGAAILPLGVAGTCNALSSVTIPEGVTTIREFAFHGNRQMTQLELPSTVTTIVQNALGMTGIRTLVLPDGITSIQNAFADMSALMDVYVPEGYDATDFYSKTMLNSGARVHMQIGSTAARTIGQAFAPTDEGYEGLLVQYPDDGTEGLIVAGMYKRFIELVLPAGITAVGNEAFLNCTSIESVILDEGLKTIGDRAFEGTQLHTVILPGSVTKIGDAAFLNNPLNDVSFAENGSLTEIGADAFRNTELSEANLPEGLRKIGNRAFLECEGLSVVTLPQTLEEIGEQAFQGSMIANVTLPERLASIGFSAFEGTQLSGDITIPASVTDLGGNAFANTGVTAVYFMGSQTELGGPVAGAETVIYAATVSATAKSISKYHDSFVDMNDTEWTYVWAFQNTGENWKSSYTDAYNGAPAQYKNGELLVALVYSGTEKASLTILDGVGVLGDRLLVNHNEITSVQLPSSLRIIDDYAFSHAEYLTGIELPEGTLSLGTRAFEHCKAMKTVTLPDSLNRLSDFTFDGCLQVPGIVLPDNMTYVGNNALGETDVKGARTFTVNIDSNTVKLLGNYDFFYDRQHPEYRYRWISSYESVYDPNTGSYYTVDRGGLELNRYLGTAAEIVVDSRVIGIGDNAFCWYNNSTGTYTYNTTLEKITFPEGMRYIRSYAFQQATKLKVVSFPSTLETIGYGAFESCPIEALMIPERVTSIDGNAFYGTKIATVTLKNDGISIGYSAFSRPTLVYCGLDSNTAHRLSNSHVSFVANNLDADHALLQDCALRYISADDGTETLRLMGYYGEQKYFRLYDKIESVSGDVELNGARILADLDSHEAWVASFSNGDETDWSTYGFTTSETDEFNYAMTGEGTAGIVAYHGTSNYIDAFPEFVNGIIRMPFDYSNTDYSSTNPIILAFKPESREGRMMETQDGYFRDPDDLGIVMRWEYAGDSSTKRVVALKYIGNAENVVIPEGVNAIDNYAFCNYRETQGHVGVDNVKSVTLPTSLELIGEYSFYNMPDLEKVVFLGNQGDGVSIGQYAFLEDTKMADVSIAGNVKTISYGAFYNTGIKVLCIEGNVGTMQSYSIYNNSILKEIVINGSIQSIAEQAIHGNNNLQKIVFGEGIQELPSYAVNTTDSYYDVRDIYLPASLVSMKEDSFSNGGSSMTAYGQWRIHAPFGSYAAQWASEKLGVFYADDFGYSYDASNHLLLTRYMGDSDVVTIPETIDGLEDRWGELNRLRFLAEKGSRLAQLISDAGLYFTPSSESEWDYRYVDGKLYGARYYGNQKEFTALPEGVEGILSGALPDDVRFICDRNDPLAHKVEGFFENSASEWKLRWNEEVLTLVKYVGSQTEITSFPEGVTAVDGMAFDGDVSFVCNADSSMAKAIGAIGYSFYTDSNHSMQMMWNEEELTLQNGANAAGDVTIPEGTTRIAWSAFQYNSNITGVTIPASVKVIEGYAFYGCDSIRKVNLMDGLTEIGNEAFTNTSSLYELRVPDSVTKINSRIFDNGTLYLPDNISECGEQSNSNIIVHTDSVTARALGNGKTKSDYYNASFTDPDDMYSYAWLDGKLYLVGYGDDAANRAMFRTDIYGMKDGSDYAHHLKTIILPSSLRDLWSQYGDRFFGSETQSITFPEGLTVIPSGTDTYENLNTVVIPRSVTTIDDNAFGAGLMTVYGYSGTEAEAYAERKGINFVDLDGDIEDDAVISPDQQNTVLHVGETVNIHDLVTVYPALSTPYPLSASCRSTSILQVQGDQVTAVAPGTATLNVWVTDHEITEISISVTVYNPVADFEVPGDGFIDINYGGKTFYVMNVTPAGYDPNFIWKDDNGTQYSSGESSWISLYSKVQRTITVTSHNGISKTFRVIGYQTLGNMTLSAEEQMKIGQSAIPIVKIKVDSTTRTNPKDLYTLTSSDESVISISENGAIHAVGAGSATVTAQHVQDMDGSKAKSVTITVIQSTALRLPAALKVIEEEAFEGISADSVIIPNGVTTIASQAFANSHVSLAVIPASVTSIANDAFAGVSNLTIQCESGSAAEAFAQANGYQVIH